MAFFLQGLKRSIFDLFNSQRKMGVFQTQSRINFLTNNLLSEELFRLKFVKLTNILKLSNTFTKLFLACTGCLKSHFKLTLKFSHEREIHLGCGGVRVLVKILFFRQTFLEARNVVLLWWFLQLWNWFPIIREVAFQRIFSKHLLVFFFQLMFLSL